MGKALTIQHLPEILTIALGPLCGAGASWAAERTLSAWSQTSPARGAIAGSLVQVNASAVIGALSGGLSVAAWQAGLWQKVAFGLALGFLYAAIIDVRRQLLPLWPIWAGAAIGLAWGWTQGGVMGLSERALAAAMAGGVFCLVAWMYRRRFGVKALGDGDVYLALAGGALVGPSMVWPAITVAAMSTALVGLIQARRRAPGEVWRQRVPFGPGLMAAFWLAWAAQAAGIA